MMVQNTSQAANDVKTEKSAIRDTVQRIFPEKQGAVEVKPKQKKNELGKEDFLKLMLTQLQHQDPFKPEKPEAMATELAQFASVEQLTNINKGVEGMTKGQAPSVQYQAIGFIGKSISTDGSQFEIEAGKTAKLNYEIPEDANKVILKIKGADGDMIQEVVQENIPAGEHTFEWNGLDRNGNQVKAGNYSVQVIAEGHRSKALEVRTSKQGIVDGVVFENGSPVLLVNGRRVPMKEVVRVDLPSGKGGATAAADAAPQAPPANPSSVTALPPNQMPVDFKQLMNPKALGKNLAGSEK